MGQFVIDDYSYCEMSAGAKVYRVVVKTSYQAKKTRGKLYLRLDNPVKVFPLIGQEIIKSGREIVYSRELPPMEGVQSIEIKFERTFHAYPMKTKIDYLSFQSSGDAIIKFCGNRPQILWNKRWQKLRVDLC